MAFGTSKNFLVLAGGLAAGVAAMYLLDPDAGEKRRAGIADAASRAASHGSDAIGAAGESLHGALTNVASVASAAAASPVANDGVRRLLDSYHDSAHYLADRIDKLRSIDPSMTTQHARRVLNAGQAFLAPVLVSAKSAVSRLSSNAPRPATIVKRSLILVPITVGGVACLAVGAGAMYLFDPERGSDRRKNIQDKATVAVNQAGRFARERGQNARHHLEGLARGVRVKTRTVVSRVQDVIAPEVSPEPDAESSSNAI